MQLTSGQRLGPYEIVSRIGAGGMGEVFKARDTRLERSVAIKILPAEFARNAQLRTRFEREAKTISQLNHPNICTLHDVGDHEGSGYLVMELLEGESLADRLARGPLPISDVLRYGVQIAEALDRAHRAGVVHRDLKPANVMLTRTGAKLLDFGLAKSSNIDIAPDGATQQKPLTQEGTILGTFQYMAPEQLEGAEADARTDLFAFGAVLYEMATGKRAFDGSTKTSLIAAIVSQDPKPIAMMQPLTPPALEHIVDRCLAKHPDDRWQSAHDVAEQLRWISEAGSQAGLAAPVTARKRSRERLAWSIAAILALALAALAPLYLRASREASRNFVWDVVPPQGMRFNAVGDMSGALVVSPDGTLAVFSATGGNKTQLWLRVLATGEAKPLEGTDNGDFPFWSPDSRKIAFFTYGYLRRLDVSGGAPVTVCAAPAARGGTWGIDGSILFAPDTQTSLYRVSSTGGTPAAVTRLEAKHTTHRWPSFLPDGKHFLYLAANHQNPTGGENGIYLGSLDGAAPKLLMQSIANAIWADGYLLFARDQTLLAQPMSKSGTLSGEPKAIADNVLYDAGIWRGAFSASDTGLLVFHTGRAAVVSNLLWVDRAGKEIARVADNGQYWDIDLSPNGLKMAVPTGDPLRELWIDDLQRNTRTRFQVDNGWAGSAVFSPDSSTVYFDVLRAGKVEILARRVTGGGETRLATFTDGTASVRSISPDGKTLLVDDTLSRTIRVPVNRPGKPEPLNAGEGHVIFASYSPDGKWIAYMSDQNTRWEVFICSASDPTQKWQVSAEGGQYPRWRRDGKEVFYLDLTGKITAVTLERSGDDLTIGTPQPLFTITPRPQCRPFDVSADGQRFIINTVAETESPNAVAIANWKTRLRK